MEEETITLKNIYKILMNFTALFDIIDDGEFNFPIYRNGEEVRKFLREEKPDVETLVLLRTLRRKWLRQLKKR